MNQEELLWLWGKTVKDDPRRYHPLLFHLLDVGHVAGLMWDEVLVDSARVRLARALGSTSAQARRHVVMLAAAHDVGKACPGFQFQGRGEAFGPKFLWARLESTGLGQGTDTQNKPHSFVSAKALIRVLKAEDWKWQAPGQAAKILAHITGAHHGTFPTSAILNGYAEPTLGGASWDQARQALLEAVWRALFGDSADGEAPLRCEEPLDAALVPLLAGMISVAD